ncbi:hypothetical protein [Methylobacterium sp. CM6257]
MGHNAAYFREKAEQCRRLARSILSRNDPTQASLNAMAAEFDAQAAAIEASVATAHVIGYGDDVSQEREEANEAPGTGNDRVGEAYSLAP